MAFAAAFHHRSGPSTKKVVEGCEEQEEEVCETHVAPRRLKTPPPLSRPGVPKDPAPQEEAATAGYVAARAPLLAVSSLRGADGVDDTAVKFFLRAELKKQKKKVEEEKERKAEEEKHERRMLALNHPVGEALPLTDAEWSAWSKWATSSSSSAGKRRKWKKRRKRKLPKSSSSRACRAWKSGRASASSLSSWPCSVSAGCLRRPLCDAWTYCGHVLMRQSWWLWTILTVSTRWAATSSVLGLPEEWWSWAFGACSTVDTCAASVSPRCSHLDLVIIPTSSCT